MKAKGHLETFNHFSIIALDAALFRESWEKAFNFKIPEIFEPSDPAEEPVDMTKFFTHAPTYRGGLWPAGKDFGVEQVSVPPIYQPNNRMIEVKAAGTLPSVTKFYRHTATGSSISASLKAGTETRSLTRSARNMAAKSWRRCFTTLSPVTFVLLKRSQCWALTYV